MPSDDELMRAAREAKQVAREGLLHAPLNAEKKDRQTFQMKLYSAAQCLTMSELVVVLAEREQKIWAAAQRSAYTQTWDHAVRSRTRRAVQAFKHHFSWLRR